MADFRSKLTLDGSDFSKTMDDAGKSVNDFTKQTQDASKQVDGLGKTTKKTASELLNEMKTMEGLGRSTSNYRSQLSQMTRQIQDLTINYNQMSNEMKNSDFGREVASQIQELTQKASEMKDQVMDAANSVKLLSSDTANLDAAKSAIEGLSAGFQLVASAGILGEESTEKVIKALARLKAIESATNAVIKISNIFNKASILMLKIKDLQTKAATRATLEHAAATGTATAAQRIFNTVAKANPYVLLATAILAVVGALTAFERYCGEAEDAQDDLNKELKKGIDLNKTYKDSFNNAFVPLLTTFKQLQLGWKDLKTDLEKTEFIKKNADEFKKLGVEITGVNQAEDILVNKSQAFLEVLTLRAQTAAAAAVAMEAYKEAMNIDTKGWEELPKAGDLVPKDVSNPRRYGLAWDHMEADGMHNDYRFTQEGANQYIIENQLATAIAARNRARQKGNKALQEQNQLTAETIRKLKELGLYTENNGNGGSRTPKPDNEVKYDENSLAYWQKQVQDIQKLINETDYNSPTIKDLQEQLVKAQVKVKEIQEALNPTQTETVDIMSLMFPPTSGLTLKEAQDQVSKIQTMLQNTAPDTSQWAVLAACLENWQTALEEIQKKYDAIGKKIEDNNDKQEEQVKTFFDFNSQVGKTAGALSSMNSSIASIGSNVEKLGEDWDDSKSAVANITDKVGAFLSIIQSVTAVVETINTLSKITTGLSLAEWVIEKKKNQEKAKGVALEGAETTVKGTNATLGIIEAITGVIKSASEIPMIGWILGLGAVAAVIAAIASAPKFAKGGIVPGNSFSGDNITAQVNSGEMILNTNQQARLFDLLNGEGSLSSGSNKVEFVIKGQELKGVLNNYDKKMSRV